MLCILTNNIKANTMRNTKVIINNEQLETSLQVMRALTHPLRLRIIDFIDNNESVHVNEIYNSLNLEQSITSQHLRILRLAGIVESKRNGKFIYYKLNYDKIKKATRAIAQKIVL